MEEGQVAQTKKRSRSQRRPKPTVPVVGGDMIVCGYTGQLLKTALVPAATPGVAFSSLPAACAYLRETVADEDKRAQTWTAVCQQYQQDPAAVPEAQPRARLTQFGGDLTIEQWSQPIQLWLEHARTHGHTVASYQDSLKNKGKKKAAKVKEPKTQFGRGAFFVNHKKGAPKEISTVDSAEGKGLTITAAFGKLAKFSKSFPEEIMEVVTVNGDVRVVHFSTVDPGVLTRLQVEMPNVVASALAGEPVFGPAIAIVPRKMTVKA